MSTLPSPLWLQWDSINGKSPRALFDSIEEGKANKPEQSSKNTPALVSLAPATLPSEATNGSLLEQQ
jgi:hypothetical protein